MGEPHKSGLAEESTMSAVTQDYIVADLALAPWGRKELAIAES